MLGRLRHAEQRVQLRQHPRQRPALAQHLEEPQWAPLAERTLDLRPHPLGHQLFKLAGGDDFPA